MHTTVRMPGTGSSFIYGMFADFPKKLLILHDDIL